MALTLAVSVLLAVGLVPHHHHDGVWCAVVEHCQEDGHDNDDHTQHRGDESRCIEEVEYLAAKVSLSSPRPVVWDMQSPLIAVLPTHGVVIAEERSDRSAQPYAAPALPSAQLSVATLRAPPVFVI